MANYGIIAVTFDPDGRGRSTGAAPSRVIRIYQK